MVDTKDKFAGAFMAFDTTQDNDIAVILGEGEETEIKNKWTDKMEWKLNIPVEIKGKGLIWTPWDSDGRALQEAFGTDSKSWVGKKLRIIHDKKKMLVRPIKEEEKPAQ